MFKVFADTHVGKVRKHNEDSYLVFVPSDEKDKRLKGALFAIADGVGGRAKGEVASKLALETLKNYYYMKDTTSPSWALKEAFLEAHRKILKVSFELPEHKGMATTCTALVITAKGAFLGHVGDSRCYLYENRELTLLTEDHTFIHTLLKNGKINLKRAAVHPKRHVLTQALGVGDSIKPQLLSVKYKKNDFFLLCSDGLHDVVSDKAIKTAIEFKGIEAGPLLIEMANRAGGPDNITVVLVELKKDIETEFDTLELD